MLLTTEPDLHRAEPKTLRYRLLHHRPQHPRPAQIFLHLAQNWRWALAPAQAFIRLLQSPLPA